MKRLSSKRILRSEEGVALPVTLIVLLLLASLTAAFAMLSSTEPQITNNLRQSSEVLALAEAGVERSIWALSNQVISGLVFPAGAAPATFPAPYDGSQSWALGVGAYQITLSTVALSNDITVTARGCIPNCNSPRAERRINATLISLANRIDPPAALTTKGQVDVDGNTTLDGRIPAGSTCSGKKGTYAMNGITVNGQPPAPTPPDQRGAKMFGQDLNLPTANETTDYAQNQPASSFDPVTFTPKELETLKAIAKANGTYYGPGSPPPGSTTYTGSVTFNDAASPLKDGIVFVDTVSGNPPTISDQANVTIDRTTLTSGWLIVMGSATIQGHTKYNGLVYVANDLVYHGSGGTTANKITGAVITQNVLDTVSTFVDTTVDGHANFIYDCNAVKTGVASDGTGSLAVPQGYFVSPGTWRQVSG